MADWAELLDAVAALLWPLMALIVVLRLAPILARHFERGTITLRIGDMEIGVQEATDATRREIEDLRDRLIALERRLPEPTPPPAATPDLFATAPSPETAGGSATWGSLAGGGAAEGGAAVGRAAAAATPAAPPRGRRLLWVDDNPAGNAFEIAALEQRGHRVTQATGTSEGLRLFSADAFDLVLTDIGRIESGRFNPNAGIEFIAALRALPADLPIWVYTSARGRSLHEAAAWAAGADRVLSSSTELIGSLDDFAGGSRA